jgi:macrocin-O-methyltransferase TylF-like protien
MEQSQKMSVYDQDGLRSVHNHEFMRDENSQRAYDRGVSLGPRLSMALARSRLPVGGGFSGETRRGLCRVRRQSRFHELRDHEFVAMGQHGSKVLSSRHVFRHRRALCFQHDKSVIMDENAKKIVRGANTFDVEAVRDNFSEWKNAEIVVGPIPETLSAIKSKQIAFLHLDLNCSLPEVATMEALWDRLTAGAFVLLDDYAYTGYRARKNSALDAFAESRNTPVLSLPTGQGLIMRPPSEPPPRRAAASSFNTNWVRRLTTHMLSSVVKRRGNRCHPDLCQDGGMPAP